MTFQVSDIQITFRIIKRTALAHALLAFAFNTFVVAFTINFIAELKINSTCFFLIISDYKIV